ncbi:hypothetical protein GCM10017674_75510 [Streptomyces gardneri]|uniref:Uncharacterized protein n=1 Tax=Streptomyces gardneri TaxID=66892 RepID=A0A4Y3RTB4_9ACTN|nr:hypothetical protein SGA01_56720 [Streptomyces gardneri]GHH21101.1 hypothetical protein GCM10017674_75510 [Streptomyces gardneri]
MNEAGTGRNAPPGACQHPSFSVRGWYVRAAPPGPRVRGPGSTSAQTTGSCFHESLREKDFQATPCPECGSYRIEGTYSTSVGVRYAVLRTTVDCKDCRSEIRAREPSPEEPSER